jgi:hypothetical protein
MQPVDNMVRNYYSLYNQMYNMREQLHLHSTRQPIFIANQMIGLPTQPCSIVLGLVVVCAIILMMQDDDNPNCGCGNDQCGNTRVSTWYSEIEDNNLDHQQEALHLGLLHDN